MSDWTFAQTQPSDELAQLHFFSMKKAHPDGDVEFVITVKEYVDREEFVQGCRLAVLLATVEG